MPSTDSQWDRAASSTSISGDIERTFDSLARAVLGGPSTLTSGYVYDQSYRRDEGTYHAGLDMDRSALDGDPVYSVTDGRVVELIADASGWKAAVIVGDSEGNYWTYGHVKASVSVGDIVSAGAGLGTVHYMWNEKAQKDITHLHLGVLTQYPHSMDGWGRDKTRADVVSNTMNPLQAYASLADNDLRGTGASDVLHGLQGDDILRGEAGGDVLYGGTGADVLRGGPGRDSMYGGTGPDVYDYDRISDSASRASGSDLLEFDSPGNAPGDKIDLSDIDPNGFLPGNPAFSFNGTRAPFPGLGLGKVWTADAYDSLVGPITLINVSTDLDKKPEMVIRAQDGGAVAADWAADDFIL